MTSKWKWLVVQFSRRLWVRAALFCILGIVTALISGFVTPLIPSGVPKAIGAGSVDRILNILASSLLAVTTFSLTVMVYAYNAATNTVTPRATKLLMQDTTTQTVLATFIGAFLFSLVGIIAQSMDVYGDKGRAVLFVVTILVVGVVVVTILRWIEHLSFFGRVGETTRHVEVAARQALVDRVEAPCLGGLPFFDADKDLPSDAVAIYPDRVGYVQHVDVSLLDECAERHDGEVYVNALPGAFVHPAEPLAWAHGIDSGEIPDKLRNAFTVGDERSFDQDPRFGLSVLAEIASRALSPAMNDPGTAIDVIGRSVRILAHWPRGGDAPASPAARYPRVRVPPLRLEDLFDDIFAPLARDGARVFEVGIRLQKALIALASLGDEAVRREARRHSEMALRRASEALMLEEEIDALRKVADRIGR